MKRRAAGMPTFAAAAARVLEQKRAGWRNTRHPASWLSSLERYAFPCIGSRPVSEVSSADVLEILTPIWHAKAQTAWRVRQRIHAVMEWAVAMELRNDNPCDRIGPVLGPQKALVEHMRAIPHQDVAAAIDAVRDSGAAPVVKLAFELLVLTATRSGEVRGALWAEINLGEMVWTIPAPRMKAMREHRVPLSGQAVEILRAARTLGDRGDESPARGRRGGAGARRAGQGRGCVRPLGPVRAAPAADERLGSVSWWDAPRGRQSVNVLTPAFVRNVARAGRYGDGRRQSPSSRS